MCNNFPNIRITEGNNFSLVLPLRSRTYVATKPIDEDIDPEQLENVVVTFGGVEYPAQRTAQGVQIDLPATLAVGTYNILLTADYLESSIRAAYESAVTIVPWSAQSTAEQYITGSPIVLRAAYVLSGAMTDAELEALKEEYREKNTQLDQAIADAEAAKREWEQKAAGLDGVAKETTSQKILTTVQESETTAQGTENKNEILAAIAQIGGREIPAIEIDDSVSAVELQPNTLYVFPNRTSNLDITLAAGEAGVTNEYHFFIEVGNSLPTITFPSDIEWPIYPLLLNLSTTVEISILNNSALWA